MKKIIAILLTLVMAFSLCACGRFESKMAAALSNLAKASSVTAVTDLDISIGVSMGEEHMNIPFKNHTVADVFMKPLKAHAVSGTSVQDGSSLSTELYAANSGNKMIVYMRNDGDENWNVSSSTVGNVSLPGASSIENWFVLSQISSKFTETSTSKSNQGQYYVFDGEIEGSMVNMALDLIGCKQQLADALGGIDVNLLDFSKFGNIPMTIMIDRSTETISQCVFDFTDWAQSALKIILLESTRSNSPLSTLGDLNEIGADFEVNSALFAINLSNYNNATNFTLPTVS